MQQEFKEVKTVAPVSFFEEWALSTISEKLEDSAVMKPAYSIRL